MKSTAYPAGNSCSAGGSALRPGGGEGGGVYSESYTRGGAIPNEVGPARCRATPALNQSADETHTPGGEEEEEEEEEEFI